MSPKSQDVKQSGLFGFLAQPDAPTKSGVVILPTIFGVNAFVAATRKPSPAPGSPPRCGTITKGCP